MCPRFTFITPLIFVSLFLFVNVTDAQVVHGMNEATNLRLGGDNYIAGTVFWPSGSPVNRRMGIRLSTPTRGEYIGTTDTFGQFIFGGLPAGMYSVFIDREDEFEPVNQVVEIVRDRETIKQSYNVSIRLKEKSASGKKAQKPAVVNAENAGVPKRALDFYEKAVELSKTGDQRGAIEQLTLAIAEHPPFMNAFNEMGVQYMRLNELEKADAALLAALKIKPDAFEPLVNRGITLFRLNRQADAEQILRSALKLKASAVAHYYLGRSLTRLGRNDEAEKELKLAVELGGGEFKEAHRLLAVIYLDRGDRPRVVEELETYLRLVPGAPDADELRQVIQQNKAAAAPTSKP